MIGSDFDGKFTCLCRVLSIQNGFHLEGCTEKRDVATIDTGRLLKIRTILKLCRGNVCARKILFEK